MTAVSAGRHPPSSATTTATTRMEKSALAGGMDAPTRRDPSVITAGPATATAHATLRRRFGSRTANERLSREAGTRRLNALTTMRRPGYLLSDGATTDRSDRARRSHLTDTSRMTTSVVGRESDGRTRGTRVVLADDDVLLREGLASLLERAHFVVVGQAGDRQEVLSPVREHVPDLVRVELRMPRTHSNEG